MSEDPDDDARIPISALQHHLFCPRQCALIHVERLWAEDAATAQGRLLHERADTGDGETRGDVRIERGVLLRSDALGVQGKADVVEFRAPATPGDPPAAFPVEYKRGQPKAHRADEVQLCAQALCLEEMLGIAVAEGALYYGRPRRRTRVVFDDALRAMTREVAAKARAMIRAGETPPPVKGPACRRCSLHDLCRPGPIAARGAVATWLGRQIAD
ncbi:MAG: CRISPR-associated protein Cas4 [Azospirillaceae bacterium]